MIGRKWVIVAFSDILGFMGWTARASVSPEVKDPFIKEFYLEMEKFVDQNNFYTKYLGDGFMCLHEIVYQDDKGPLRFLEAVSQFTKRISILIKKCAYPQPDGFRTRIVVGHVDKFQVQDPQDKNRKVPEYVGYAINLAQRLLEVKPRTSFICHESVLKIFGDKKATFKFRKVEDVAEKPRGVNELDIQGLWSIKL